MLGELVCNAEKLAAGVRVCEGPDAQTVGGIQLPLEELAAGLLDLSQLEKTGCREQCLDVSLLYSHLRAGRSGQSEKLHIYLCHDAATGSRSCCLQSVSHLSCGILQLLLSLHRPPHTDTFFCIFYDRTYCEGYTVSCKCCCNLLLIGTFQ